MMEKIVSRRLPDEGISMRGRTFPISGAVFSLSLYLPPRRRNAHKFRVEGGGEGVFVLGVVLVCPFPPSWHLFARSFVHE